MTETAHHKRPLRWVVIVVVLVGVVFYVSNQHINHQRKAHPGVGKTAGGKVGLPKRSALREPSGNKPAAADFSELITLIQNEEKASVEKHDQETSGEQKQPDKKTPVEGQPELSLILGSGQKVHQQTATERFWNTLQGYIQRRGKPPATFP